MQQYISSNRIGKNIRRIRKKCGMRAVDVITRLHVDYDYEINCYDFSRIENNHRDVSLELASKLICLFGSTYDELVLGKFDEGKDG